MSDEVKASNAISEQNAVIAALAAQHPRVGVLPFYELTSQARAVAPRRGRFAPSPQLASCGGRARCTTCTRSRTARLSRV